MPHHRSPDAVEPSGFKHYAAVRRASLPRFGKIMLRGECSCRWRGGWHFGPVGATSDRALAPASQRAARDVAAHLADAVLANLGFDR